MAAYVVVTRETAVANPEAMEAYRRLATSNGPTPGLKVLAAYGGVTALEGEAPDGAVVIEFPNVEMAKAWFYSPHYQAAVAERHKAATFRSFIIEGLPTPAV